jgi:hypothetical protein
LIEVNDFRLEEDELGDSSFKLFPKNRSGAKNDFSYDANEIREVDGSDDDSSDAGSSSGVGGEGSFEVLPSKEETPEIFTPKKEVKQSFCVTEESDSTYPQDNSINLREIYRNNS